MQQYCAGNAVANESGSISMLLSLSLALLDTQDTQGSTASNNSIKSDIYKQKVETHTVVYIYISLSLSQVYAFHFMSSGKTCAGDLVKLLEGPSNQVIILLGAQHLTEFQPLGRAISDAPRK